MDKKCNELPWLDVPTELEDGLQGLGSKRKLPSRRQSRMSGSVRSVLAPPNVVGNKRLSNCQMNNLSTKFNMNPNLHSLLANNASDEVQDSKMSVLDKLHIVLMKKGYDISKRAHNETGQDMDPEELVIYNEFRETFEDEKYEGEEINEMVVDKAAVLFLEEAIFDHQITPELERENKRRIMNLHQSRIKKGERNFLMVVEKDNFERLDTWKPKKTLKKIYWNLIYLWSGIRYISKIIISHNAFEGVSIFVILVNSVF